MPYTSERKTKTAGLVAKLLLISVMLTGSASSLSLIASEWIEAGAVAPYAGNLRTKAELDEDVALMVQCESNIKLLLACRVELDEERSRCNRWYKRPAVWVTVSTVTFTVGLLVGLGLS